MFFIKILFFVIEARWLANKWSSNFKNAEGSNLRLKYFFTKKKDMKISFVKVPSVEIETKYVYYCYH